MKSLRTFLLATAAVFAAAGARAEYLLWTMDWTQVDDSADYAQMAVFDSSGNQVALLTDTDTGITQNYRDLDNPSVATEAKSVVDSPYNDPSAGYTFAIMVYDNTDKALSKGETKTYSQLQSAGYIWGSDGGMNHPTGSSTTWSPTTYGAVPEPATGTLLVVGSLLLFRRRKQA